MYMISQNTIQPGMRPVHHLLSSALAGALLGIALAPGLASAQGTQALVIHVSSEALALPQSAERCEPELLPLHEKAKRDPDSAPSMLRYAPVVAGVVLGGFVGLKVADKYKLGLDPLKPKKWPRPVAGLVGAAAGGLLGLWVTEQFFPLDEAQKAPQPEPGVPMPDQVFLTETVCAPATWLVHQPTAHYWVTYRHGGQLHTARVPHYPGARIALTPEGRPVDEVPVQTH